MYAGELFGCSPLLWAIYRFALDNQTSVREVVPYDTTCLDEFTLYAELPPKWLAAVFGTSVEEVCEAIEALHTKGMLRPVEPESYGAVGLYAMPYGQDYKVDQYSQALRTYRKEAQQRRRSKNKSHKKAS